MPTLRRSVTATTVTITTVVAEADIATKGEIIQQTLQRCDIQKTVISTKLENKETDTATKGSVITTKDLRSRHNYTKGYGSVY